MSIDKVIELLIPSLFETLYMIFLSTIFSVALGLPLAIALYIMRQDGLNPSVRIYKLMDAVVNILRSFPFIILMIVILPLTKMLVGTKIGTTAAIVPLTVSAVPFIARLFEQEFISIDKGIIEAAKSMGSTNCQIIWKVVVPESMPGMISAVTVLMINLVGYSAMAGTVGGGGLGNLAIRYGYNGYETNVLIMSVLAIIVIVEVIQLFGNYLSIKISKK